MNGYLLDTSTCVFLLRGKRSVEEKPRFSFESILNGVLPEYTEEPSLF